MRAAVPLASAREESVFGAKAAGLGEATRAGLPVPPGVALSGPLVEGIAGGRAGPLRALRRSTRSLTPPFAVRSSCVDEDGAEASFAGQHVTVLNVSSKDDLRAAVSEVWWSANSDSALTYRRRVGVFNRPSVAVVVQALLDPQAAGVMFTRNPVNGAEERMIEASFGLGEAVVAGRVIPDSFRLAPSGEVLERRPGVKKFAIRADAGGGTHDEPLASDLVEQLCLSDGELEALSGLARRCEEVYGPGRDIEWAFAGGVLYLLQCRAMTKPATGPAAARPTRPAAAAPGQAHDGQASSPPAGPAALTDLGQVPLFAGLSARELVQVRRLFRERRFPAGETVTKEGTTGAAFFVIEEGEASVSLRGREVGTLGPGDHFGEIALIDEGPRTATVAAVTDLACQGLTLWDFRPLLQQNPTISWKVLQALARKLREAEERSSPP